MKRIHAPMRFILYIFLGSSLTLTSWQLTNVSPKQQLFPNRHSSMPIARQAIALQPQPTKTYN